MMKTTQCPLPGTSPVVLNEAKIATLLREVLVAKQLHEAASLILMTLVLDV